MTIRSRCKVSTTILFIASSVALACFLPWSCSASSEVVLDASGEAEDSGYYDGDGNDDAIDDHYYDNSVRENVYWEYEGLEDFPYFPEEFAAMQKHIDPMDAVFEKMDDQGIHPGHFILDDFVVGGVNLATYQVEHPPFQLYEDFDIGSYVVDGPRTMSWKQLVGIRNGLERPSLSWYVDKVARKRWFREQGIYPQPETYLAKYKDELSDTGRKEDETKAILAHLPTEHGFCAKPTHMSMTMGNWLVDIPPNRSGAGAGDAPKYTNRAQRLAASGQGGAYDPRVCADSLAEGLQREATEIESWALKNVRPGIVIEELYSAGEDRDLPPHEFCMFVVWGRVYAGQWNLVGEDRYMGGFFYRDGSAAPGCPLDRLPDWVPWNELVEIAESLSQHKDMFRVDMFVGVPRYSGEDEGVRIAVSESEVHPTTMFCNPFIAEEMARLWVAGYRIGSYEVIPNDEVPVGFYGKSVPGGTPGGLHRKKASSSGRRATTESGYVP